jgi:hypothetical protein
MTTFQKLRQDRLILLGGGLCLLFLGEYGWATFGDILFRPKEKPAYTHLHCSECLDENRYSPVLEGSPCPVCGEAKAKLIPTVGSLAEGGFTPGTAGWGKIVAFLVVTVVLGQLMVFLCLWRLRFLERQARVAQNRMLNCRCPFCNRKLGYPVRKAGHGVVCQFCKTAFLLPNEDEVLALNASMAEPLE